jgi:hypothetical protein
MLRFRFLAVILALVPAMALAQLRTIPEDAKPARIRHVQEMDVLLDGKREQLAPGAQIRSAGTTLLVPTALPADALVRYRRNGEGRVHQVWILTPREAAQLR